VVVRRAHGEEARWTLGPDEVVRDLLLSLNAFLRRTPLRVVPPICDLLTSLVYPQNDVSQTRMLNTSPFS
jgi:hypothetical protein